MNINIPSNIFQKRFQKFLKPENYISALERINRARRISKLSGKKYPAVGISTIWEIPAGPKGSTTGAALFDQYYVFSKAINLNNVDWHKDISSGYIYPSLRIDKLKTSRLYNKGIDILYVWVQSRFHFAVNLAQMYLETCNEQYYLQFRKLVLDWIDKNPFLYGVNWLSPMEAAIRSINWITAVNLFGKIFNNDTEFKNILSVTLQQHADYIANFPEVYSKGHTTNHTASDYTGLLFIALTLKDSPGADKWLEQSINGIISCIDYQVYEDGVDFEGSIPYHRLVLELFSYSAILCRTNNIALPDSFYSKLFRMIEFTAAYIDKKGNAPCIGDDDSGRILVFNKSNECNFYKYNSDHSYLLEIGEHVFNYRFLPKTSIPGSGIRNYLPVINKINPANIGITTGDINKLIVFNKGGAYFLKNQRLDFMLACFPIGQNGHGGHNHFDQGSFTLSADGDPLIVDPGTYVYSSDKAKRDIFRSYKYHNTLYSSMDMANINETGIWETEEFYYTNISGYNSNNIEVIIKFKNDTTPRKRRFEIEENQLLITDNYDGLFFSRLNFHPDVEIISSGKSDLVTNKGKIFIEGSESFSVGEFEYSPCYQKIVRSKYLNIKAKNNLTILIKV